MTYPLPLKILGVGRYLPERIVPSSELEGMAGLKAGWIERKQGVKERRRVAWETSSAMSAAAAREALDDAGLQPAEQQKADRQQHEKDERKTLKRHPPGHGSDGNPAERA